MRPYFAQLLGIDPLLKPWTGHLMRCATAVAHIAYMYFKARFKRVRPSRLCPGLAVPFGPPEHPAFPSGHSTAAHLVALCLLQVPAIAELYGVDPLKPHGPRARPRRSASWSPATAMPVAVAGRPNRAESGATRFPLCQRQRGRASHRHQDLGVRLRQKDHRCADARARPPSRRRRVATGVMSGDQPKRQVVVVRHKVAYGPRLLRRCAACTWQASPGVQIRRIPARGYFHQEILLFATQPGGDGAETLPPPGTVARLASPRYRQCRGSETDRRRPGSHRHIGRVIRTAVANDDVDVAAIYPDALKIRKPIRLLVAGFGCASGHSSATGS